MIGILHATQNPPDAFIGNYRWFTDVHPEWAPNTLISPLTMERFRFIPAGVPSKALRNLDGGVETNHRPGGVHQVEIVCMSEDVWAYPDWWYANLQQMLREESEYAGIPYDFWTDPTRFTMAEWDAYLEPMWYRHSNVPENNHTDPGTLDYNRLENLVITPQDLSAVAKAVWEYKIPAVADDLVTESPFPAGSVLSWDHKESKTVRIKGSQAAAGAQFSLQSVSDELLLAEVARRFKL
jgi:hypothetical protein